MNVSEGATFEVELERILPGGFGLAHAGDRTIFVSLAAPGDVVRIKIDRLRGRIAFASILEVIKPSQFRIEPPCPYFGRCGGCDFQQLTYEAQLRLKSDIIRDCLYRIARLENPPEISVIPSPHQWRYRARANWQVDRNAGTVGYFERGTHDVCDVADCAVLRPELQQALENVRSLLPDTLPEDLTEIEAVSGDEGVALAPPLAGYSDQDVTRRIGGEVYRFGATSFFQINHELLERLIATAVADTHGQAALDLYCGVGLFTLPLARRYPRATAVEANKAAANYARLNLSNAQLTNATVITARVAEWLNRIDLVEKEFDFVLLDPPRTGAEPVVIERILALRPRKISYVSCDPATLARDLKLLLGDGYQLTSVAALDMFPQTHHVETVVQLTTG